MTFDTVAELCFVLVFKLKGVATFPDGTQAEQDLELKIPVEDVNDNQPVFSFEISQTTGAVNESSATGIPVTSQRSEILSQFSISLINWELY